MEKHVVLIDDDPDDAEVFRTVLHELSTECRLTYLKNSERMLSLLNSGAVEPPALIFLDLNMPVVDGWEMLITIKLIPELRSVPVYIYSTSKKMEDQIHARKLGASGFISKPDSFAKLREFLAPLIPLSDGE